MNKIKQLRLWIYLIGIFLGAGLASMVNVPSIEGRQSGGPPATFFTRKNVRKPRPQPRSGRAGMNRIR
ncbi:MAG TPA: hypothetical protein PKZ53_26910 [Acidobacteriota bacterium]|nr:hypothetical protein [Acidobacteriota bacterium]